VSRLNGFYERSELGETESRKVVFALFCLDILHVREEKEKTREIPESSAAEQSRILASLNERCACVHKYITKQIGPLAAAGYHVVAPDQRGYNLSDVPKAVSAYRMDELVRDVVGLLDALGRADCYLVGHDWGAAVAWATAMAYPRR
jgi:pimeloyl-ACP methyl ester carboxylesterase